MHGHRHVVAIALLLAAPRLFAACEETLRPALVRELTAPAFKHAASVAWLDDEALAIARSESMRLDADTDLGTITIRVLGDGPIAGASLATSSGEKVTTDAEGRANVEVPQDGTTLTITARSFLEQEVPIDAETPAA